MSDLMISVQVARTRLYRVVLWLSSSSAAALILLDRFGPGLTNFGFEWELGLATAVLTFVVTTGRQIKDPSTTLTPTKGDLVMPAEGATGPEAGSPAAAGSPAGKHPGE